MKKLSVIFVLVVMMLFVYGCDRQNKPSKDKDNSQTTPKSDDKAKGAKKDIPADIPPDVREQIERLYSADPAERGCAADRLGEMGEKAAPAVPFLVGILHDASSMEWWQIFSYPASSEHGVFILSPGKKAAEALGKIGKPAVEPLIAALKDGGSDVRFYAALALGKIGDKRAVEPLIAVLKDEDSHVRRDAAWALGKIGDKRAVEPLIAALKDEDSDVRFSAELALTKITGKDFGEDQAQWRDWWEQNKASFSPNNG